MVGKLKSYVHFFTPVVLTVFSVAIALFVCRTWRSTQPVSLICAHRLRQLS